MAGEGVAGVVGDVGAAKRGKGESVPCIVIPPEPERRGGGMVRLAREARGMTEAALAREIGTTAKRIIEIERSREMPDSRLLGKIADATNYPLSFFEQVIAAEDGPTIMCGERDKSFAACVGCGCLAEYLCDYPMGGGKTCDAPLCLDHAMKPGQFLPPVDDVSARLLPDAVDAYRKLESVALDVDYCPAHWIESQKAPR